jgi:hypothetical protein
VGQRRKKAQHEFMGYRLVSNRWNGKWLIAYLDDASRFMVEYGVFDEATTENAISY